MITKRGLCTRERRASRNTSTTLTSDEDRGRFDGNNVSNSGRGLVVLHFISNHPNQDVEENVSSHNNNVIVARDYQKGRVYPTNLFDPTLRCPVLASGCIQQNQSASSPNTYQASGFHLASARPKVYAHQKNVPHSSGHEL